MIIRPINIIFLRYSEDEIFELENKMEDDDISSRAEDMSHDDSYKNKKSDHFCKFAKFIQKY